MLHADPVQIIPPTRLLFAGHQRSTRRTFARRSAGTNDWLLIFTEGGQAYFRFAKGEFLARKGDIVLISPNTPQDYGLDEKHGYWNNHWAHFLPRPECLEWMRWPEFAPGMRHLHLIPPFCKRVSQEFLAVERESHIEGRRQQELAINALERALLLCDSVNPRYLENRRDIRIRKAVELLGQVPELHHTLGSIASHCGISRSRFADLFKQQVGVSPFAFLETQRLRRVRELLEHTSFGLAEIAERTGYSSPYYLSLRFKKLFNISPREYRKKRKGTSLDLSRIRSGQI